MLLGISIGKRLFIGALFIIIFIVFISLFSLWQQSRTNTDLQAIVAEQIPKLQLLNGMRDAARYEAIAIRDITLQADIAFLKSEVKNMKAARQTYDDFRTQLLTISTDDTDMVSAIASLDSLEKNVQSAFELILELNLNEDQEGAFERIKSTLRPAQTALFSQLENLYQMVKKQTDQEAISSQKRFDQSRVTNIIIGLVSTILAILIATIITRDITRPMRQMQHALSQVAHEGNFAVRITLCSRQKDEVAQTANALNLFLGQLQQTIEQVNHTLALVAKGEFHTRLTNPLKGELESLRLGVNLSVESVSTTMSALSEIMQALYQGNFSMRMDDRVPKQLREQVDTATSSLHNVILNINQVMDAMAKGDFKQRINVEARGELKDLVGHINASLDQLTMAIDDSVALAKALSDGDFSQQIVRHYSGSLGLLQTAMNQSIQKMATVIQEIVQSVDEVSRAAVEINHGNQDLNERTQQQATAIEKSSSNLSHITQMLSQTAHYANQSNQLSRQAESRTHAGSDIMRQTLSAMTQMKSASQQVSEITGLIDSIAFQTNLLALNAAVEAARAGDHGRGFAVVAGEVRNLAQKSANAAKEIRQLIDNTIVQVEKGTHLAEQSGEALTHIEQSIVSVTSLITEVTNQSQQQQHTIEGINQDMQQMESATQQNAALVEEIASSTDRMQERMQQLAQLVAQFKLR